MTVGTEIKYKIKVHIDNIKVSEIDPEEGNYSFDYCYSINGKKTEGTYDSDYEGWTESGWKKELEKGEALNLILQQISV